MTALVQPPPIVQQVYVLAGEVHVATDPTRFSTVLGSCVAVCLYDTSLGVGGINHVQMPDLPPRDVGSPEELTRWAIPGTQRLIDRLVELGSSPSSLRAKLFGGACISASRVPEPMRIGSQNVRSVLSVLHASGIRIGNSSTGGNIGVKVLFDSHSGSVWVKKLIPHTRAPQS